MMTVPSALTITLTNATTCLRQRRQRHCDGGRLDHGAPLYGTGVIDMMTASFTLPRRLVCRPRAA